MIRFHRSFGEHDLAAVFADKRFSLKNNFYKRTRIEGGTFDFAVKDYRGIVVAQSEEYGSKEERNAAFDAFLRRFKR